MNAEGVAVEAGGTSAMVDTLYRDHGDAAFRLGYLLTGDRARAEDLVQDAFVRVLARVGHIREPGLLRAYLTRTIVNLAKNEYRRTGREHFGICGGRAG